MNTPSMARAYTAEALAFVLTFDRWGWPGVGAWFGIYAFTLLLLERIVRRKKKSPEILLAEALYLKKFGGGGGA